MVAAFGVSSPDTKRRTCTTSPVITCPSPFGLGEISPSNPAPGVGVGVAVGVAVGVGVGVGVGVAVGVGVGVTPAPVITSANARVNPISCVALSLTFSVQLPFAFCPSNADSALLGAKFPVSGPPLSPPVGHWEFTGGKPPSSFNVTLKMLLPLQLPAPGRLISVTVVPAGDVSLKTRSPIHEWLTPTVVDAGSALAAVPPILKSKSEIVPTPPTASEIFTPAGLLSGITTAGPVKLTVVTPPGGVGVGVGVAVGAGVGVGVGVPVVVGVGVRAGVGVAVGVGVGVGVGAGAFCVTVCVAAAWFCPLTVIVPVRAAPVAFAATA